LCVCVWRTMKKFIRVFSNVIPSTITFLARRERKNNNDEGEWE
jgi:hypothetical protein